MCSIAAALAILLSLTYIPQINRQVGEYYTLLLLATVGMMMMGAATDLIVVFLALEIFSLALYILTGLHRSNPRSTEASMKYFLLGAFASPPSLSTARRCIYGATGSTAIRRHRATLAAARPILPALSGHGAAGRRLRLQGEPGPLPHVDARCLPGRAHAGDGLHERRHQGCRLRRLYPCLAGSAARRSNRRGAGCWQSSPCSP